MEYDNTNTGTLFKHDKKGNDKAPDYSGTVEPECPHCHKVTKYRQSAWINEGKKGKFMKQKLSLPDNQRQAAPAKPSPASSGVVAGGGGFDDDIPFNRVDSRIIV